MKLFFPHSHKISLIAALLTSAAPMALMANPVDGVVSAGSASISSAGSTLTINQSTDKAVIDWRGFDIDAGETTRFQQPSSRSLTLNRVGSGQASKINGNLTANGNIIIVNPNGVVFGAGSKVDVNGLVATSADISNSNLMAGQLNFNQPGNPNATIENRGEITAAQAGLVGLVAPNVINSGIITAKLGRIHLASGDTLTVDLYGDGLLDVKASDALRSQLVDNTGTLAAEGGTIAMTAAAGRETVDSLIHVGGTLDARGIGTRNGRIVILAEGENSTSGTVMTAGKSRVVVDGKLDVSNVTGTGGTVAISADEITLANTAVIDADGQTGGGVVHVGGELHGEGTLPIAFTTVMQDGAVITADALENGHGGEVVMYADNRTEFYGSISANGEGDGDGGMVETSGRVALLAYGRVSATTRRGRKGEWLLDPGDITITASTTTNNTTTTPYAATGTGSQVSAANIKANLDAGTNVTVITSNDGFAGNGDIIVNAAITTTGSGSLTLSAYRNINVTTAITLNGGSLLLRADNANSGSGSVRVTGAVTTNGGDITIGGGSGAITAGVGFASGNIDQSYGAFVTGTMSAGGGNIIINGQSDSTGSTQTWGVWVQAAVSTTGTGSISITGIGRGTGDQTVGIGLGGKGSATNVLQTVSGSINLTGTTTVTALGSYGILMDGAGAGLGFKMQTTSGAININGTGSANATSAGHGIRLKTDVQILSTSGAVTMTAAAPTIGDPISANGTVVVNSGSGAITINADSWATGMNTATFTTTGTLTVANKTAGKTIGIGTGSSNLQITDTYLPYLVAGSYVFGSSSSSTVTLNTARDFTTKAVSLVSGSDITASGAYTSTGNGALTLNAYRTISINAAITLQGGALTLQSNNADTNIGRVYIVAAIATNGGNITIGGGSNIATGYAYGYSGAVDGVAINGVTVDAGSGLISIRGHGWDEGAGTGGSASGIWIAGAVGIVKSSGNITVVGVGGNSAGDGNHGVRVISSAKITGLVNANVSVTGTAGGNTASSSNSGVYVGSSEIISTVSGTLTLTGTNAVTGTGTVNVGVSVVGTAQTGSGDLTISNSSGSSSGSSGVQSGNSGLSVVGTIQTTNGGNIIISNVTGGAGVGNNNYGVSLSGSGGGGFIKTTNGGNITISGTGGAGTGSSQHGVILYNGAKISTGASGGNITITGTGGVGAGAGNVGINVNTSSSSITAVGGTITLNGFGSTGSANSANYGLSVATGTSNVSTSGSGSIIVNVTGGSGSKGLNLGLANALQTTGTGNITVYADTLNLGLANNINSIGTLTMATATNIGLSVGAFVSSTLNISDTYLGYINGASYIFGSTTLANGSTANTSDVRVNTAYNFVNKNVTFISGQDINLAGTLTKATGTGTVTYTFQANRYIYNSSSAGIAATTGTAHLIFNADYDQASAAGGTVYLTNATLTTNGGNITIGGGTNPTSGYAQGLDTSAVLVTGSTLSTGAGNILIRGLGTGASTGTNQHGVGIYGSTLQTTSGNITIYGTTTGAGASATGINLNGATTRAVITTGSGAILLVGAASPNNTTGTSYGIQIYDAVTVGSTSGNIELDVTTDGTISRTSGIYFNGAGTAGASSNGTQYVGNGTSGTLKVIADKLTMNTTSLLNTSGVLTLAPYTSGTTMGVGPASGSTLNVSTTMLGYTTAGSYVFGATNSGDVTLNTTTDFSTKNVTLISGRDLYVAGAYTSTGNGALTLSAVRNIYNNANITLAGGALLERANSADVTTTGTGGTTGGIYVGGNLSTAGGNITLGGGSGTISAGSGYAVGNGLLTAINTFTGYGVGIASGKTISAAGGAIIINGRGAALATDGNYGIYNYGGTVSATSTGTVTLNGIGGGITNSGSNHGVFVSNGGIFSTIGGDLTVTGTGGGAGTGTNNEGVYVNGTNSTLKTTGAGNLRIINAAATSSGRGVYSSSSYGLQTTGAGSIFITNAQGVGGYGVYVSAANGIAASGSGAITITATSSSNSGIMVQYSGSSITANGGDISLTGTGGASGSGMGVFLNQSALISNTGAGNITLIGTGGGTSATNGNNSAGVDVDTTSNVQAGSGTITLTGVGGGSGTGNNNHGVILVNTNGVTTAGNIIITGTGGANSSGLYTAAISNAAVTTGSGNISIYVDKISLGATNAVNAAGVLTLAVKTAGVTMGIGPTSGATLNVGTAATLAYLNGASYVFGSTSTGDLTINTTYDFGNKNVTFISGGNITLTGALTKASGTGTANYLFQANGNITTTANITASTGAINLTLDSDYEENNSGYVNVGLASAISTNGGSITIGGGTAPLTKNAISATSGATIGGSLTSGAGNISIRGENTSNAGNPAAYVGGSITTTTGNVTIYGKSSDSNSNGRGILVAGTVTTGSGNITLTGVETSGSPSTFAVLLYTAGTTGGSLLSASGNILIDASTTGTEIGFSTTRSSATGNAIEATAGNVTILSDKNVYNGGNAILAGGVLTLATKTGVTMGIGPSSGSTALVTTAVLGTYTAGSYVFGSTITGDVTINTTYDFGNKNVTFISGQDINIAGTLNKATGAGMANYTFQAYRDIYNSSSAGVTATTGAANIVLQADYNGDSVGAIYLTGGSYTSSGGAITFGGGSNIATGYAYGRVGHVAGIKLVGTTVNSGSGNLTMRGHGYDLGGSNHGIWLLTSAQVISGGVVTITGVGGGDVTDTAGANNGVYISSGTIKSTGSGSMTITGTGGVGAASSGSNLGVLAAATNAIQSTGTGTVYVIGTGGGGSTGNYNYGVQVIAADGIVASGTGSLDISGNGGRGPSGHGIIVQYASSSVTANGGDIILRGQKGTDGGNALVMTGETGVTIRTVGSGNITAYVDLGGVTLAAANNLNSVGTLTIAAYGNTGFALGAAVAGAGRISDTSLAYINAASYIFGSTTTSAGTANTSDVTINTTNDFGAKNVKVVSGNDITLAGAWTSTGAGALELSATRNITTNAAITTQNGALTLRANNADLNSGAVTVNAAMTTNNGAIKIGGGSGTISANSGYAIGNSAVPVGVGIYGNINAGTGDIIVNGKAYDLATGIVKAVLVSIGGLLQTSGSGNITVYGDATGTNTGSKTDSIGIWVVNGGVVSVQNGTLTMVGSDATAGTSASWGVYVSTSGSSTIKSTGNGLIDITGTASNGTGGNIGITSNLTNGIQATGAGAIKLRGDTVYTSSATSAITSTTSAITIYADNYVLGAANGINAGGVLTLATYTNKGLSIGASVASTANISTTKLGYISGASYVFGSTTLADGTTANTGDVTINTAYDFGNKNVTFISGQDINIAGTLTKATGASNATYMFAANRDIYNTNSAGIATTTGTSTIILNADYNADSVGAIYLTNGTFASNGGNITLGGGSAGTGASYAYGRSGHVAGISLSGATVDSGAGTLTMRGHGYDEGAGTTGSNYGISIASSGQAKSTGAIVAVGVGGASAGDNNYGVAITTTNGIKTTGGGHITVTGTGGTGTGATNHGVYINSGSISTLLGGNLTVTGTGGATSAGGVGIYISSSTAGLSTADGTITLNGTGATSGTGSNNDGIYVTSASTVVTSGTGNIIVHTSATGGSSPKGLRISTSSSLRTTGTGNITVFADVLSLTAANNINSIGTLTMAAATNIGVSLGTAVASTLNIGNTYLGYLNAASYIFGSATTSAGAANTGDVTINTTYDFADKNVTVVSGQDIALAGTLTKATGTGTATYTLNANRHITNTSTKGFVASTGAINLVLSSDNDVSGSGAITLASAPLTTNGGTISMNSHGQAITLSGSIGGATTLTSGNGAISLGVLDGDTVGTRNLSVDAGTNTITTTGAIGGTTKLNDVTFTSDDLALGANLSGSGVLTLQTSTNSKIMRVNYNLTGGDYNISSTEQGYIQNGFSSIILGSSTATGQMYVGSSTWHDSLTLRGGNNRKDLLSTITVDDGASLTVSNGSTYLYATLNVAGDITLNTASGNYANTGLTMTAGGNITVNDFIQMMNSFSMTAGGNLTVTGLIDVNATATGANLTLSGATVSLNRIANGASVNMGAVSITAVNAITLPSIDATSLFVRTTGAAGDITIGSGKTLSVSNAGDAMTLASARNFINNGTVLVPNGRWFIYSTNPASDTLGGLTSDFRRFSLPYSGSSNASLSSVVGNGFLYSYTPVVTVTPNAQHVTYGSAANLTNYGYTLSGYLSAGDATVDAATGTLNGATPYVVGNNAGNSYDISYSSGSLSGVMGYSYTYVNRTNGLTVDQKALAVTLTGSVSKTYDGDAIATLAGSNYSLTGVYGGDDVGIATTAGTYNNKTANTGKTVTVTGLTLNGTTASNYTLSSTTTSGAVGTILQKDLTLTGITAVDKTYDGTATATLAGTAALSGNISGDSLTINSSSAAGNFTNATAGTGKTVTLSGYAVTGGDAANYNFIQPATVTADIIKKQLDVTADAKTITYGTAVPTATVTYSGFVGSEGVANLTTAPTLTSAQSGVVNAATYTGNFTATGGAATNYSFNYIAGDLVVNPKTVTVTAGNKTITYGDAVTTGTVTYSGFITGQDETVLSTAPTVASAQSGLVNAGTYTGNYTAAGAAAANYNFSYVAGNLVVNKKTVTITAADKTITYGDAVTAGTVLGYSGFIVGQNESVLTAAPTITSSRSGLVNAGTYANNYMGTGATAANYDFAYVGGSLIVNKKLLTVTANSLSAVYGNGIPVGSVSYSGFVTGQSAANLGTAPTVTSVRSGLVNVGSYAGNYVASGASSSNYNFSYVTGSLTVTPRSLTVVTSNAAKSFGDADPAYSGSNNLLAYDAGLISWTYAPAAYGGAVGSYTITATASDPSSRLGNYTRVNSYGLLTVYEGAVPVAPTVDILPSSVVRTSQVPLTPSVTVQGTNVGGGSSNTASANGTVSFAYRKWDDSSEEGVITIPHFIEISPALQAEIGLRQDT